jgi:hypothetical protein
MLRIKAEKERPGNTMPRCFEYEGRVLDTSTIIDGLCKHFEQQVAQESGGVK